MIEGAQGVAALFRNPGACGFSRFFHGYTSRLVDSEIFGVAAHIACCAIFYDTSHLRDDTRACITLDTLTNAHQQRVTVRDVGNASAQRMQLVHFGG
jgi:hypothetical protein